MYAIHIFYGHILLYIASNWSINSKVSKIWFPIGNSHLNIKDSTLFGKYSDKSILYKVILYHVSQYAEVKCQTNDYYSKYTYCFPRAHIVVVAENTEIKNLTFCAITFEPIKIWTHEAPQNDRLNFSFVTDIIVNGKKMSRNGCKMAVCQSPHLKSSTLCR